MAWFLRSSKHGPHVVYGQQAQNSCGIACVIMVNFKMKQWRLLAAAATAPAGLMVAVPNSAMALVEAVKSEKEVDAAYAKVTGRPYDGSGYTSSLMLPKVLNQLGIGTWTGQCVADTDLAGTILKHASKGVPVIALVHWRRGGGHFVVCDNIVGGEADFCDPWDAAVRTLPLVKGQKVVYQANNQSGYDFGQTHKTYSSTSTADMDGWVIYQTGK